MEVKFSPLLTLSLCISFTEVDIDAMPCPASPTDDTWSTAGHTTDDGPIVSLTENPSERQCEPQNNDARANHRGIYQIEREQQSNIAEDPAGQRVNASRQGQGEPSVSLHVHGPGNVIVNMQMGTENHQQVEVQNPTSDDGQEGQTEPDNVTVVGDEQSLWCVGQAAAK